MTTNPLDAIAPLLTMNTVWFGVKTIYLIAFLAYIGFTIIVISQVKQMAKTIKSGFDKQINLLSWSHFGLAVLAFILAFMVL